MQERLKQTNFTQIDPRGAIVLANTKPPGVIFMKKIQLTRGQFALVDDEDYDWLTQWKWYASKESKYTFYATRMSRIGSRRISLKMHSALMCPPYGMEVDHVDGNGLNNQRGNLRVCTRTENCQNRRPRSGGTSKYKGVHWGRREKKWIAKIHLNGKEIYLGRSVDEDEAASIYDTKAKELFGEFARLNLPEGGVL
jgi:hypothetical protein